VITDDGSLYTFGAGTWGVLGHGDEQKIDYSTPKRVEYFVNKGKKIQEAKAGKYHTVALTEDGEVYTFGYGGKVGYFSWLVAQEVGALGHGDRKPYFIPKKVEFFNKIESKVVQIVAGLYHSAALTEDGDLYVWGRGQYGVLGNGGNKFSLEPELNEDIAALKEEGIRIKKIDWAEEYTTCLMNNGEVYSFGKNDRGQLGTEPGIGTDFIESCNSPTPLVFDGEEGKPMDDIYWGQSTMLLKDENGAVWRTGLKLHYSPKIINLDSELDINKNITTLGCGQNHYCLVNEDNQLLVWGKFFNDKSDIIVDGFKIYDGDSLFNKGRVTNMSVKYNFFGVVTEN
jgi:alpha-tubulin suppressor-like RCC1 family protein